MLIDEIRILTRIMLIDEIRTNELDI